MTKPRKKANKAVSKKEEYSPSEEEINFVLKHGERGKGISAPKVKVIKKNDAIQMKANYPDPTPWQAVFEETYGTTSEDFALFQNHLMANVIVDNGTLQESSINAALAAMFAIAPKDEIESMLATQMVAVHVSTMNAAGLLNRAETINQKNSAANTLTKLSRTFTAQLEALNRYRGKGQQKMTVEHVHVHEGGQAIVGNVEGGGKK